MVILNFPKLNETYIMLIHCLMINFFNNENVEVFTWLFKVFTKYIRTPPKAIITNQNLRMKEAITKAFPTHFIDYVVGISQINFSQRFQGFVKIQML